MKHGLQHRLRIRGLCGVAFIIGPVIVASPWEAVAIQQNSDVGAVGDVKYSLLAPKEFRKVNGRAWILMTDEQSIAGSRLSSLIHTTKLPDARGVFIRGMNEGRDSARGDSDGNRPIGAYQSDDFKSHDHDTDWEVGFSVNGNGTTQLIDGDDGSSSRGSRDPLKTKSRGGNETRPRNIALYVYVKLN